MSKTQIHVPDVGSSDPVDVIEISVKVGDTISAEDTIIVLESDKATVEVPAPQGGKVAAISVKVGDRVKEGDAVMELEAEEADGNDEDESVATDDKGDTAQGSGAQSQPQDEPNKENASGNGAKVDKPKEQAGSHTETVKVPDLGDIDAAEIIEVNVAVGDELDEEQVIVVVESDKASLAVSAAEKSAEPERDKGDVASKGQESDKSTQRESVSKGASSSPSRPQSAGAGAAPSKPVHAGPAVRKLARETGVDLSQVSATGPKDRILKDDVHAYVKQRLEGQPVGGTGGGLAAELPEIDFSQFGDIERVELNKLRKVSAQNLTRSWLTIPHVTQHDNADITELEAFRKSQNKRLEREGVKLTMLAFLVTACARALTPADMKGGTFSISSLGGIGGTAFTPIVNWPEVAILGVSRSDMQPVWDGNQFQPRLILPLSLSYDHRVIDGAAAARFTTYLSQLLTDMRQALL